MIGTWQPIETAPKDGTRILVAGGTRTYSGDFFGTEYECREVYVAWWDHDGWNGGYGEEYNEEWWHRPTHWMPLPAPPANARNQGLAPQGESHA